MARFVVTIAAAVGFLFMAAAAWGQETPKKLTFAKQPPKLSPDDTWSYLVSSSDASLDGRILKITFKGTAGKTLSFAVQLGDQSPKSQTVSQATATFLSPTESAEGQFTVVGIGDEYPESVEQGMQWQKNNISFTYDANNVRTTSGYRIFGTGPHRVVTPVGGCPCAELEWLAAADNRMLSARCFNPQIPVAVRSRERRPKSTAVTLFELQSFQTAALKKDSTNTMIDGEQRQKAIEWLRAHNTFGATCQVVDDFIFQLHTGARESPASTLRWMVGSELTKDGKGFRLEWTKGKFSSQELTAQENAEIEADKMAFLVME